MVWLCTLQELGTSFINSEKSEHFSKGFKMQLMNDMKEHVKETEVIDYVNPDISDLATLLSKGCSTDSEIAKNCFEYVRDSIRHSGDYKEDITTCKASEVLKHKTGWCYAKSHLLAALLRANGIPAGLCYQRLKCSEYRNDIFCLHGLNALYLKDYGWFRVDARGNKEGVNAQFNPPVEKLAFELEAQEFDLEGIYAEPLNIIVQALKKNQNYEAMVNNLPDCTLEDISKYNKGQ